MEKVIIGILAVLLIIGLVACGNKNDVKNNSEVDNNAVVEKTNENGELPAENGGPKNEQTGTARSNIPLIDSQEEAKYQIEVAMQHFLEETYGDEVVDARIYVEKIYSPEETQEEPLKSYDLKPNEIPFEVKYELKLAEGVEDTLKYTVATGEYDEESGWVTEKYNLGILRPNPDGEPVYIITNFGTGW